MRFSVERCISLLSKILAIILEEIPSDKASAFLFDERNDVIFKKTWPAKEEKNSRNEGIGLWAVNKSRKKKQPVLIPDVRAESDSPISHRMRDIPAESVLCLPLLIDESPVGALCLERNSGMTPYSTGDLEFLIALSKPLHHRLARYYKAQNPRKDPPPYPEDFFIGKSKEASRVRTLVGIVKDNEAPVFICGESGTGKELIARAIHERGARKDNPFVAVNCGAIPDHLLESELFGYTKGAFTGAYRDKAGLIEEAGRGTFFLDEIGDLSPHLQAKLLRLLQEKEIRRVGENRMRRVNVRFISATNKNIDEEIRCGHFREDLYYRLRIITIDIPPLRERKEDILLFLNYFLERYCRELNKERVFFSPQVLELLLDYSWPGNVRELQNEIQKCLILSSEAPLIREEHLSPKINPRREPSSPHSLNYFEAKAAFEKRFLRQALLRSDFNRARTAGEIGLTRQGLFKLMKKHKINTQDKDKGHFSFVF